jgi:hypothetical protein
VQYLSSLTEEIGAILGSINRLKFLRLRTSRSCSLENQSTLWPLKGKVFPKDLSGQTLLLTEGGCAYRKKLDELM